MRICSIGECMVEFSNIQKDIYKLGYAGDTANSAIYLSRLGAKSSFVSCIGSDDFSNKMLTFLKKERVQTHNIYKSKSKTIGLYVIKNKRNGERNFFYWRSNSAAKTIFENMSHKILFDQISKYDAVYFSGITLSIYNQKSISKFYKVLRLLKEDGIQIYFDFNVRLKNWESKKIAQQTILKFSLISDIIFMTKDDLDNLDFKNYKNIIKKKFKNKITIFRSGYGDVEVYNKSYFEKYKFNFNKKVKDTTGCGDAFNACFIYNYFTNKKIEKSLKLAHRLGKTVANFKGAIIDKKHFNPKLYAN